MVYGNNRKPPGSERSPSQKLLIKVDDNDDHEDNMLGIWAPPNALGKAVVLKHLFPTLCAQFKLTDVAPLPPHIAVAYDAFKGRDVMELSLQYPGQVLAYGYFTSDIPGDAQLIAKTLEKFENKTAATTYEEKIIVQLAKVDSECLMAFAELGPSYMSTDTIRGEEECKIFFPEGYNVPEPEMVETKKKPKKKNKTKPTAPSTLQDGEVPPTETELSLETAAEIELAEEETLLGEEDNDELMDEDKLEEKGDFEEENTLVGADKSTSPMNDNSSNN